MFHKRSSVLNSIYSGQQRFSYTGRWIDKQRDKDKERDRQTEKQKRYFPVL